MRKYFLFFVVLFVSSNFLSAQNQGISLGGNILFPVGEWADVASTGFGGSVTYEHSFERTVTGVIYSGYSYFDGATEGLNWSMIPLVAGVKFYTSYKQDWYFAALLGVNFITAKHTSLLGDVSETSTEFQGNANFGYELKIDQQGTVDFSGGFVYVNQQNYIGVRIAYIFKL